MEGLLVSQAEPGASDAVAETTAAAMPFRLAEAYARRDLEALMALFTADPDVTWVGTGADELRVGPAALRTQFQRNLSQSEALLFRFASVRASVCRPAAWVTAEGTMCADVPSAHIEVPVRLTAVLVEREGRWLMAQAHLSCPAAGQAQGESFPTLLEEVAYEVRRERPDLGASAAPDGTVTILFTDIEDSTALNQRLGDHAYMAVLNEHNEIVRRIAREQGGFEVKSRGDGFMLAFASARRALLCAIGLQRAFARRNAARPNLPVSVRIGLHTGEAVREADDFFGTNVVLAARVAGAARGGEILASSLVKALCESAGDIDFGPARDTTLKGLGGTHRLFEVGWREAPE